MNLPPSLVSPDADLLKQMAGGSACERRAAHGELARRYVHFVHAAALRQLGDSHAAEDATQTVFMILARKAGRIRAAALASWLHQTTCYAAANARRANRNRRRREQAAARAEAIVPLVIPEPDPLLPLLDDAIARLGARDRRAIIDRYLRGRDVATVAGNLGVSPAAAQKRLERAIIKLRRAFVRLGYREAGLTAIAATLTAVAASSSAQAASPMLVATVAGNATPVATTSTAISLKGIITLFGSTSAKVALASLVGAVALGGVTIEAVRTAGAQPVPGSSTTASTSSAAADFSYTIPVKPGQTHFLPGDNITLSEIRSTSPDLQSGICRVSGKYTLASQESALLAGSVTSRETGDKWNSAQQKKIARGSGTFTLLLPISVPGEPHVSFYGTGESFGGVYFADNTTGSAIHTYDVSNPFPKLAPFLMLRFDGEVPSVRIDDAWYTWASFEGRPMADLIADAKRDDARSWQKRIGEDLVELCDRSGHPVGETVSLGLIRADGKTVQKQIRMTAENRRSVLEHRTW